MAGLGPVRVFSGRGGVGRWGLWDKELRALEGVRRAGFGEERRKRKTKSVERKREVGHGFELEIVCMMCIMDC